jgi:hypothetical protein
MRRIVLGLALLVPLACAEGSSVADFSRGGGTPVGAGGTGGASTTATTTSTSGATGTTSSGAAPTSCSQANGSIGCCIGDTAYFCDKGTLEQKQCSGGDACGWNTKDGYYACVSSPGGADPSGANPIHCN